MNMVSDTHSPASTGAPYLSGNFGPVADETTAFGLDVIGRIPPELNGRFLRLGPNPIDLDPTRYHWFTGTGMAHGLRVREGKAEWYRSRFVIDGRAAAALGREPIGGPGKGKRDRAVNTSLIEVGGKLCAIVESGSLPVELNYELESVRRTDFDGTLEAGFSGHARLDPITGEQHALAYEPGQPVRYISVGRDGRAATKARIELPHIPLIHDMAFTESFIVVPDFPVTFQPTRSHTTFPWLSAMKHDLQRGTTEVHQFGPGQMTLEPIFVQKAGAVAEDEGWIMRCVYDPERNLSDVVILDAQDFSGGQVARIHLPARVPFGFHGAWVPEVDTASVIA